jgi:hypothetical protein
MENKNFNSSNDNTSVNPKKENIARKVGDKIERLGEKISDAGAKGIGKAVYNAGNKLEHSMDDKDSTNT